MKKTFLILLCFLLGNCFIGCKQNVYPISKTEFMLDTVITITIYDGDPDALNGAITLCKNYENLLSKTVQSSDVYKINHSNDTPTDVSPDTAELLKTALVTPFEIRYCLILSAIKPLAIPPKSSWAFFFVVTVVPLIIIFLWFT